MSKNLINAEIEFGKGYRIPPVVAELVRLRHIEDLSHHNDACPSFGAFRSGTDKHSGEDQEVRLWVEHPKPEQREITGGDGVGRFNVTHPGNRYKRPMNTTDIGIALIWLDLALREHGFNGLPKSLVGTAAAAAAVSKPAVRRRASR
jgi:hypothetical protein